MTTSSSQSPLGGLKAPPLVLAHPKASRLVQAIRIGLALASANWIFPAPAAITCPVNSPQTVSGSETLDTACNVQAGGSIGIPTNLDNLTTNANLNIQAGGSVNNSGSLYNQSGATLGNAGSLTNHYFLSNSGTLNNQNGATLGNTSTASFYNYGGLNNDGLVQNAGTIRNYAEMSGSGQFNNTGSLTIEKGGSASLAHSSNLAGGTLSGGQWNILADDGAASLEFGNGSEAIPVLEAGTRVLLSGAGAQFSQLENHLKALNGELMLRNHDFTNSLGNTLSIGSTGRLSSIYSGINNVGSLVNDGSIENTNGTISNTGTLTNRNALSNSYGSLINQSNATLTNQGQLSNDNDSRINNQAGAALTNAGLLSNTNHSSLTNAGDIHNQSGATLLNELGSVVTNTGSLNNNTAATLTNQGDMDNQALGSLTNGGILNNAATGKLYNRSGAGISNTGTVNTSGLLDNFGTAINQAGGTLNNTGRLYNESGSTFINQSGATVNNHYGIYNYSGSIWVNEGIIHNTSNAGIYNYAGAALTNKGLIDNQAGSALFTDGSLRNDGIINNAGKVTIDTSGSITGTGSFIQSAGLTQVSGLLQQTTIDIQGGELALVGAGILQGNLTVGDGATFNILSANSGASIQSLVGTGTINLGAQSLTLTNATGVFAGNIEGTGGLTVAGGHAVLTGTNTYTGGTTIDTSASLALGSGGTAGSITGNVIDNGTLVFNRSDAVTFAGSITGSGSLIQAGTGSLNLNGTETLGSTLVQQGTLAINGTLNSSVGIAAAGSLRGTGIINGPVTVSGTLAPGNSPGTLTTNGTVTMQSGSTFQAEIDGTGMGNGAGNYSRLIVSGTGNQFVANGANLNAVFRGISGNANNNFTPRWGDKFKLVTAEGGIVGRFANSSLTGLFGDTQLDAFYHVDGGHSIELVATPNDYAYALYRLGGNYNAQAVGKALNRMRMDYSSGLGGPQQDQLRYSMAGLNATQLPQVATALAGEVQADMAAIAPEAGRWLQNALARQLDTTGGHQEEPGIKPGDHLWFDFTAAQGHADGDAYASSFGYSRYQFAIGGDVLRSQANRFGVGITYATASVSPGNGSGTVQETAPFVYGQYAFGKERRVILDGLFAYGFTDWQTQRSNPLYATGQLKANASGSNLHWGVGVRSPWELGGYTVEPFLRVLWQNSNRGSVSEGLISPSALQMGDYSQNGTRLLVGAAAGSGQRDPLADSLTYRVSLAFGNDFGDLIYPSVQATLAGQSFQIASPHVGRQFVQLNLSGTYKMADSAYAYVGLNGEARENRLDGSVNAGFNLKF